MTWPDLLEAACDVARLATGVAALVCVAWLPWDMDC